MPRASSSLTLPCLRSMATYERHADEEPGELGRSVEHGGQHAALAHVEVEQLLVVDVAEHDEADHGDGEERDGAVDAAQAADLPEDAPRLGPGGRLLLGVGHVVGHAHRLALEAP